MQTRQDIAGKRQPCGKCGSRFEERLSLQSTLEPTWGGWGGKRGGVRKGIWGPHAKEANTGGRVLGEGISYRRRGMGSNGDLAWMGLSRTSVHDGTSSRIKEDQRPNGSRPFSFWRVQHARRVKSVKVCAHGPYTPKVPRVIYHAKRPGWKPKERLAGTSAWKPKERLAGSRRAWAPQARRRRWPVPAQKLANVSWL